MGDSFFSRKSAFFAESITVWRNIFIFWNLKVKNKEILTYFAKRGHQEVKNFCKTLLETAVYPGSETYAKNKSAGIRIVKIFFFSRNIWRFLTKDKKVYLWKYHKMGRNWLLLLFLRLKLLSMNAKNGAKA